MSPAGAPSAPGAHRGSEPPAGGSPPGPLGAPLVKGLWSAAPADRCVVCYRRHGKTGGTRYSWRSRLYCGEACRRLALFHRHGRRPGRLLHRLRDLVAELEAAQAALEDSRWTITTHEATIRDRDATIREMLVLATARAREDLTRELAAGSPAAPRGR